jgi:hypothetical protein
MATKALQTLLNIPWKAKLLPVEKQYSRKIITSLWDFKFLYHNMGGGKVPLIPVELEKI